LSVSSAGDVNGDGFDATSLLSQPRRPSTVKVVLASWRCVWQK